MNKLLQVGQVAPDFTLTSSTAKTASGARESLSLNDFRGKNLVLVFYPADWSAVCGDELALFNEVLPMFDQLHAHVVGISVDGVYCHAAFKADRGFRMSLLADFEPKGEVARRFGVYDEEGGVCERALFVVDAGGTIRYSFVSPDSVNPGVNEVLKTLKEIQHHENPTG